VWDYPRPPAVKPCDHRVRVEWAGEVIADSALRCSRPVTRDDLHSARRRAPQFADRQRCPSDVVRVQGEARYLDAIVTGHRAHAVAWSYPPPAVGYETLRDHVAFYPGRLDAAWQDDERVRAQSGDFYGGWITGDLAGPSKGPPGTHAW
jgi:uncharacterized protein (DUF427 family)